MQKNKNEIVELWNTHAAKRLKEIHGDMCETCESKDECQSCTDRFKNDEAPAEIEDYIFRCISDFFSEKDMEDFPLTCTYSRGDRTEFENIVFLIEQTNKLLFPDGDQFVCSIIYDEYNIEHGTQGLYNIIGKYVNWQDKGAVGDVEVAQFA